MKDADIKLTSVLSELKSHYLTWINYSHKMSNFMNKTSILELVGYFYKV